MPELRSVDALNAQVRGAPTGCESPLSILCAHDVARWPRPPDNNGAIALANGRG